MQARGGGILTVCAGQTVYTPPGEQHCYGAAPGNFMGYLALVELADGDVRSTWLDHVTDEEYDAP
jgi:quercetin dioxygenase-like cupin family protein